jgi:hypothetical protein
MGKKICDKMNVVCVICVCLSGWRGHQSACMVAQSGPDHCRAAGTVQAAFAGARMVRLLVLWMMARLESVNLPAGAQTASFLLPRATLQQLPCDDDSSVGVDGIIAAVLMALGSFKRPPLTGHLAFSELMTEFLSSTSVHWYSTTCCWIFVRTSWLTHCHGAVLPAGTLLW